MQSEPSALSAKLGQLLSIPPSSTELLPGDGAEWLAADMPADARQHAPFLYIEGNLGVPQKLAYKAYLESVPVFRRCRARLRASHLTTGSELTEAEVREALASTAVLLLVNPAHQSALNARKRLVQLRAVDAAYELRFASALLTLHEGAKQSLLWHHRRWLLRRIYPEAMGSRTSDVVGDGEDSLHGVELDADAFRTEVAVVVRACEVYPRNYHAWTHRYLCAEALVARIRTQGREDAHADAMVHAWRGERARVREWIERHVSDYSAMQYACRLEVLARRLAESGAGRRARADASTVPSEEERETACEHAWSLVQAYPAHESLWLYLRGALSLSRAGHALAPGPGALLVEARTFAERILRDGSAEGASVVSGGAFGECALVRNHAVRFLAWLRWKEGGLAADERVVRDIAAAAGGCRGLALDGLLAGKTGKVRQGEYSR
ncbi:protein prenylyltransferase [Pilatotrama ljubarskyi]|nr:protein prenylyltransferase [Pilatotrama ljubarskyi]